MKSFTFFFRIIFRHSNVRQFSRQTQIRRRSEKNDDEIHDERKRNSISMSNYFLFVVMRKCKNRNRLMKRTHWTKKKIINDFIDCSIKPIWLHCADLIQRISSVSQVFFSRLNFKANELITFIAAPIETALTYLVDLIWRRRRQCAFVFSFYAHSRNYSTP